MPGMHDAHIDEHSTGAPHGFQPAPGSRAPWWRHLAVIFALAALTRFGLYFAGVVAMLLYLSDLRRQPYTRLGGTAVLAWWTFVWARASVPPFVGLGMLAVAAAAYAAAAVQERHHRVAAVRNAVLAVAAAAIGVLNVAPYGTESPRFDKAEALTRAVAASRGDVHATHAQVARTRERFDQRPLFLVLLFELNPRAATTTDGEPCFIREEVHIVDALDGSVDKARLLDRLTLAPTRYQFAQAREKDGNCLPLPVGTRSDIVRIPGR